MRTQFRHVLLLAPVAIVALAIGGNALGSGVSVSLKIKREYGHRHATACHKTKAWRLFHRGSMIEYRGLVTPPPARHFSVRLEVKHCVAGVWRDSRDHFTLGKAGTGEYKGLFKARPLAPRSHKRRAIAYYEARAIVNGFARSRHEYFAVTN